MHARILVPCVIIFMRRVLKNYLHRYWRTVVLGGLSQLRDVTPSGAMSPLGSPRGQSQGLRPFLILINDLSLTGNFNAQLWKYADDTTTLVVVAKGGASNAQHIADCSVAQWFLDNRVQLNSEKCKELTIKSPSLKSSPSSILFLEKLTCLKQFLRSAKQLGVNETVKKASDERLYFLVQLKRARLPCRDLVLFYVTCRRTILVYVAPVFFYALPKYLRCELERVQKRAMSIICPICLMTRHLRKLVFQTLFHIARTYVTRTVTRFLTLPLATRITNLTSY